jgi:glycosyltransferase involved in cell wall biosynthesis
MSKLLSIITITRNDLHGLKSTLQSITNQNCSLDDLEWIVIDGDSNDGSVNYLQNLSPDFDFTYISEKDSGIFDAMNKGVKKISGQYLLFLNAGDALKNDSVLNNISPYLKKNSSKIIAGTVHMKWKDLTSNSNLFPWVPHQAAFIHKSCFKDQSYDSTMNFYGDLKFWMTLKAQGLFLLKRVNIQIVEFYMGGVGNNPKNIFKRLSERNKLGIEFNESYLKVIARTALFISHYLVWKILGLRYYYKLIMGVKN